MKRKIAIGILIIDIILCIYSSYQIIKWNIDNKKTSNIIQKINIISKEETKKDKTISIDFNSLLNINNEVVGWIKVKNTNINYPILKHNDNDYYLTHSFDKSINSAGWIFMDYRNNENNLDNNTIIYGHGRKDGTMFGSLFKVIKKEWYTNKDNLDIDLTTLNNSYTFNIFSIYVINTTDDYININYNEEILNKVVNRSIYNFNTNVDLNDKILTLSTCYNNEKKIVIHAKLIYNN